MKYAVFIAHDPRDLKLEGQVRDILAEVDQPAFPELDDLVHAELPARLAHAEMAIAESSCLLAIVSPRSTRSAFVAACVRHALSLGRRVVALLVDGARPSPVFPTEIHHVMRIATRHRLEARTQDRLIRIVRSAHRGKGRVVAMLNMKGGVGKTTLAAHLIGCLHESLQRSVLLVDLDPQHNLSQLLVPMDLLHRAWAEGRSVMSMFEPHAGKAAAASGQAIDAIDPAGSPPAPDDVTIPLKPRVEGAPRFDLAPGHFEVIKYTLPRAGAAREALHANFTAFIAAAQKIYDLIVIDVNPGASYLTEAALTVATNILSPVRPDRFSKRGLDLLDRLTDQLFPDKRPPARIAIMNGVARDLSTDIETEVGFSEPNLLESRISQSEHLLAASRPVHRKSGDLSAGLAYRDRSRQARPVRLDLEHAAAELARKLDI